MAHYNVRFDFKSQMAELGYNVFTTFWDDFSIADRFGVNGIKDTYKRAFEEWKWDYKYLTELVMVLNRKIWYWYKKDEKLAKCYNDLWMECDEYAYNNLKGEEFDYFIKTTD